MPSAPKQNPLDADPFAPVQVTARQLTPMPEDIPEITVSGERIPWYVWVAGGVLATLVIAELLKGRR